MSTHSIGNDEQMATCLPFLSRSTENDRAGILIILTPKSDIGQRGVSDSLLPEHNCLKSETNYKKVFWLWFWYRQEHSVSSERKHLSATLP
jgi:hypothetical protein